MAGAMRWCWLLALLLSLPMMAQDAERFARACKHRNPRALDRWMKHELHRHRKGTRIMHPGGSYVTHTATYDSLVAWLARTPGVRGAAWDKCTNKIMTWPGRSTLAVQIYSEHIIAERCYDVQEGRPGTIQLPGWRPQVRKAREELKFLGARECNGSVAQMRALCEEAGR